MSNNSNVLVRLTAPVFSDNLSGMMDYGDPATIASTLFDQSADIPSSSGLSELFVSWGQFVDHDLSHTPDSSGEFVASPGLVAPLERSAFDQTTGTTSPRAQINTITPQMDANMVYGSDTDRTDMLRSFEGGKLKVDALNLMPKAPVGTMAGSTAEGPLFLAGDVRANENVGLTSLHTLFVREHNYWADRLAEVRPHWTDMRIFETARTIVEYEIQKITMEDWLPKLIGSAAPARAPYDPLTEMQISTEFSTAAFRFGHTMVPTEIKRLEEDGTVSPEGHLTIRDVFFSNDAIIESGLADLFRGAAANLAQELDTQVIDDLNFFLQMPTGMSGFSLPALNILRGRDHGIDTYINTRAKLLGDVEPTAIDPADFSVITSDPQVAQKLASVYATVHDVDLWVGGLAEDNAPGAELGPLFVHIIAEQFARTMTGDESFMDLPRGIPRKLKKEIKSSDLSDIILRNTEVTSIQEDVFQFEARGASGSKPASPTAKADPLVDSAVEAVAIETPFSDFG